MKRLLLIATAMTLVLAGCSAADLTPEEGIAVPPVLEQTGYEDVVNDGIDNREMPEAFAVGNNTLGFDAASLLYTGEENLALSPASLELALLMTRAGAIGETAQEMAKALGMSEELSDDQIIAACAQLMRRANTDGMEAAYSIWIDDEFSLSGDYMDVCTGDFLSDAYTLDLGSERAVRQINNWASDKTHGRIKNINEQPLPRDTMLVLVNALYFLGEWVEPFEAKDTHKERYAAPSGDIDVQMMNSTREVPYYDGQNFDMISLDFQSELGDAGFAMAFLLPDEGGDVTELLRALDGDAFAGALAGMRSETVQIKLPKFEFTFGKSFAEALQSLGMERAFGSAAQFDNVAGPGSELFISDVLHKCYIRVDELGAEAAAVTEVMLSRGVAPVAKALEFHADRPFLFAIYGKDDGIIYFMGAVNNPLLK